MKSLRACKGNKIIISLFVALLFITPSFSYSDVLILSPNNKKANQLANKIKEKLQTSNVVISEDITTLENPELIVTLGAKLLKAHSGDLHVPTVASFISPSDLPESLSMKNIPSEAIYSVVSPKTLMSFLEKSFGNVRVGYIYKGKKDRYVAELEERSVFSNVKFQTYEMVGNDVFKTLRRIITSRSIDVMVISSDAEIYNRSNIRFVLEALYRKKIPTIGLSERLVDAGAVAAVFSEEDVLIERTIAAVNNFLITKSFNVEMYASLSGIVYKDQFAEEFNIPILKSHMLQ